MNIFADFHARIAALMEKQIAAGILPPSLDLGRFVVEPPRDPSYGDLSTNAAMIYAREAKDNPRVLAEGLALELAQDPDVARTEVAGVGFINILLKPEVYRRVLRTAVIQGSRFGAGAFDSGDKVNVEYVSANPTGPMHVGHARGAVFGDALANLLEFAGDRPTREYYVNDAGAQVDALGRSAFVRYREALGENIGLFPEGLYPGEYLKPVGEALAGEFGPQLLGKAEVEWLPLVRKRTINAMMEMIRDDLAALKITHEVFASERELIGGGGAPDRVRETIDWLRSRDLVYEGRLPRPRGSVPDDWEEREQVLFRSTKFGDDVDRPLIKADGTYTYFATDVAYHKSKIDRGYLSLVDIWGADHGGYVKRMQAAVAALSQKRATLDVRLCQLVRLMRGGEQVRMSKRAGDFITLREVVDEVGADAVRFIMLMRKNDAPLDFDLAKVIEQSQENPVFYVQYAYARSRSVLRQGRLAFPDLDLNPTALAGADLSLLIDAGELDLMRTLAHFPRVVLQAAAVHEPHRITFFAHDLAARFHAHWNRGKDSKNLRFINETSRRLTYSRLCLTRGVGLVLASALSILGVTAPDEMR